MPESKRQRRFMGMVHAVQKGEIEAPSKNIAAAAKRIDPEVAHEIGSHSEKGLPESKGSKSKLRVKHTPTGGPITKKKFD
jgi:hypothetical protein